MSFFYIPAAVVWGHTPLLPSFVPALVSSLLSPALHLPSHADYPSPPIPSRHTKTKPKPLRCLCPTAIASPSSFRFHVLLRPRPHLVPEPFVPRCNANRQGKGGGAQGKSPNANGNANGGGSRPASHARNGRREKDGEDDE
ncbi:hypothetical protein C8R45DRAFT_1221618 [Mycena sanguinolenta]|nr:hypothetical protein C8R45DRAFT_1221618 [Mycena sanguinolenta]